MDVAKTHAKGTTPGPRGWRVPCAVRLHGGRGGLVGTSWRGPVAPGPIRIGLAGLLGVARVNAGSVCASLACVYACKEVPAGEGVEGL